MRWLPRHGLPLTWRGVTALVIATVILIAVARLWLALPPLFHPR